MSGPRKNALIIGLGGVPDPSSQFSTDKVKAMLDEEIKKFDKVGIDAEPYYLKMDSPTIIEDLRRECHRKRWDAVNIGFGIRGDREQTGLFEKMVNAIVEEIQPAPKFLFALQPNLVFEAGMRVFPELNKATS